MPAAVNWAGRGFSRPNPDLAAAGPAEATSLDLTKAVAAAFDAMPDADGFFTAWNEMEQTAAAADRAADRQPDLEPEAG
jgi:hypothetical protein